MNKLLTITILGLLVIAALSCQQAAHLIEQSVIVWNRQDDVVKCSGYPDQLFTNRQVAICSWSCGFYHGELRKISVFWSANDSHTGFGPDQIYENTSCIP